VLPFTQKFFIAFVSTKENKGFFMQNFFFKICVHFFIHHNLKQKNMVELLKTAVVVLVVLVIYDKFVKSMIA